MPESVRLSTKGQLVIPKALRDALHWHEGDELSLEPVVGGIVVRRCAPDRFGAPTTIDEVLGSLARYATPRPLTVDDMEKSLAARFARERVAARPTRRRDRAKP